MANDNIYRGLDSLIQQLYVADDEVGSIETAIKAANEVMRIIMPKDARGDEWGSALMEGEGVLDRVIPTGTFPNSKVESWFEKHPYIGGERAAMRHFFVDGVPFESKFYWLNKSASKSRVAAGVMLTPNWEDSDLTKHPNYKVGIDFFLSADAKSLLVVVSNLGNLRVMELSERLSNTQIELLSKIDGAGGFDGIGDLEPQQTIHRTLWEAFALKEVNKKFYVGIATHFQELLHHLTSPAGGNRKEQDAKLFANRLLGRLLFIWFLRKKGFIDESVSYFEHDGLEASEYYEKRLKALFFVTLNTPIEQREEAWRGSRGVILGDELPDGLKTLFKADTKTPYLNGGLFEPHPNDWAEEFVSFPKSWFDSLYNHFEQFNFTTDESTPEYEQVAIDPEMLGRVFENLLASQLTETGDEARKASGSFYTPREIVSYMCKETLRQYLYTALESESYHDGIDALLDTSDSEAEVKHSDFKKGLWGKEQVASVVPKVQAALERFTLLDPACGSGAFPMGMLQLLMKTNDRLEATTNRYEAKLSILSNNIFGVDIEPMAVEISRLRAWLSLVVDEKDSAQVKPLPNLDFRFVCANSLVPLPSDSSSRGQSQMDFGDNEAAEKRLKQMKLKYFSETVPANKHKQRVAYYFLTWDEEKLTDKYGAEYIDKFAKENNLKFEHSNGTETDRFREYKKWDPFDLMAPSPWFDAAEMFNTHNGFDAIIGNPPYIHLEDMKELSKHLYQPLGYQSYEARGDIYSLFYERGVQLLKDKGVLCYITSNKWMRAAYGGTLREYFSSHTNPVRLIDFAGQKIFDATVDTNILVLRKEENAGKTEATIVKEDCTKNLSDYVKQHSNTSSFSGGSAWVVLSSIERRIKEKIEAVGVPLKDWDIKINRGILTGCNEAFIIDGPVKDRLIAKDPRSAEIIRPILRGRDIKRYSYDFKDMWLIASHNGYTDDAGRRISPINIEDYPAIKAHLDKYWEVISVRTDKGVTPYNLRNCAYMDDFSKQKIVWGELSDEPKFAIDQAGEFSPINTVFLMTGCHLQYLIAFLNSPVSKYFFSTNIATTSGMGTTRWLKYTIEMLPVPVPTREQETPINNTVKLAIGDPGAIEYANELVYSLYGFSNDEMNFISSFEKQ